MTILGDLRPALTISAQKAPPRAATETELVRRGRQFAELETLIRSKERSLRLRTWAISERDARLRLRFAAATALRRAQLVESARLAGVRRRRLRHLDAGADRPEGLAGAQNRIVHPSRRAWSAV